MNIMETIEVTNPSELEPLSDFLHDSYLDIDTFNYDRSKGEISVIFKKELYEDRVPVGGFIVRRYSVPVRQFVLTISNVTAYELNDTEGVGYYDLCQLLFDPVENRLEFPTGVPLHFAVNVSALKMRLDRSSSAPVWVKRRLLWFLSEPFGFYRDGDIDG